jgi:hypothetical protein
VYRDTTRRWGLLRRKLDFFRLDASGNKTLANPSKLEKAAGKVDEVVCYRDCRPLFPHKGVYFASCLLNRRNDLGVLVANGAPLMPSHVEWDILVHYSESGRLLMRKTRDDVYHQGHYDAYHQGQCDAEHYDHGRQLARAAAAYDSWAEAADVVFHDL